MAEVAPLKLEEINPDNYQRSNLSKENDYVFLVDT